MNKTFSTSFKHWTLEKLGSHHTQVVAFPKPARKPLVAAVVQHTVKLGTHKRALEKAGVQGVHFTKGPHFLKQQGPWATQK